MVANRIQLPREQIAEFCRQNSIYKLCVFGSVLREDFLPESDIDILVFFEPGARVGLIRLSGLEMELSAMLGRKTDVRTPADISPRFREKILADAETLYERS